VPEVARGVDLDGDPEGAMVDAYVITDRPDEVEGFLRESGWSR